MLYSVTHLTIDTSHQTFSINISQSRPEILVDGKRKFSLVDGQDTFIGDLFTYAKLILKIWKSIKREVDRGKKRNVNVAFAWQELQDGPIKQNSCSLIG